MMTYEEACKIIKNSINQLTDTKGDHMDAVRAAVSTAKNFDEDAQYYCAIIGFSIGCAYGIRQERARRHK